ncbi:MAG: hypothetical protein Q4D04_13410 [Clostridia bacterium]|nr:hypothetical protein [Clostridia bacterium]
MLETFLPYVQRHRIVLPYSHKRCESEAAACLKSKQLAKKMILSITRGSQTNSDHDIMEIVLGILYDALQACYGIAPDWNSFVHGGQFAVEDETVKAQFASFQSTENQEKTALWATRVRIRDFANRRRTWLLQIGIRRDESDSLKLYYALSYCDHLAGSFSPPKPLIFSIKEPVETLFSAKQICCMCGSYPWPSAAVELRHALLPDFLDSLHDSQRNVPIVLISCPDLVNPDALFDMAKGNFLVCWCADASVISRLNDCLPEQLCAPWDSVRIYLPFGETPQYHPLFTGSDIERTDKDAFIFGFYQAYCQHLRAEDRRAFVTLQDIAKLRDNLIQSALRERLTASEENARKLSEKLSQTTTEYEDLQKRWTKFSEQRENSTAAEYEEILNEALNEIDALKKGITRLTARLYADLGKTYKPDPEESNAYVQDLSQAIFCCLSRANSHK